MNPENIMMIDKVADLLPAIFGIVVVCVGGSVFTTWLRIKHGYPLESTKYRTQRSCPSQPAWSASLRFGRAP